MRISRGKSVLFVVLASAVGLACSASEDGSPGADSGMPPGSDGGGLVEIENASGTLTPAKGLLARELDVTLSLQTRSLDPKATLDLGTGITVSDVKIASATSLTAHVRVESNATLGKHDARILGGPKTLLVAGAFEVFPTVDVKVEGSAIQGGVVKLTLTNKDSVPFDKDFELDDLGEGFYVVDHVSDGATATFHLLVAPRAPAGKIKIVGGNKSGLAYYADPNAFELGAYDPPLLAAQKGVTLATSLETKVYKLALPEGGPNGAIFSVTMTVPKTSSLKDSEMLFYGAKGTFAEFFADILTPSDPGGAVDANGDPLPQPPPYEMTLTIPIAHGALASEKYLQIYPSQGVGALDLTPSMFTANVAVTESATSHGTAASAQDLGAPPLPTAGGFVISGQLATSTELDVYKFTAAKGDFFEISVQGAPEAEVWISDSALAKTDTDPLFAYASNFASGGASGTTPNPIATADLDIKKNLFLVVVPYAQATTKTGNYTVAVRKL